MVEFIFEYIMHIKCSDHRIIIIAAQCDYNFCLLLTVSSCAVSRQGVRVGVLSGPGYCAKSRHHNRKTKSSETVAVLSHRHAGAAAAFSDNRLLPVQIKLPDHLGSTSNVRWCLPVAVILTQSLTAWDTVTHFVPSLQNPDMPMYKAALCWCMGAV